MRALVLVLACAKVQVQFCAAMFVESLVLTAMIKPLFLSHCSLTY